MTFLMYEYTVYIFQFCDFAHHPWKFRVTIKYTKMMIEPLMKPQ